MNIDNSTIILDKNPWQVDSIQDFICLKCPECDFCSKEEIGFQKHAINCHPLSFVLFAHCQFSDFSFSLWENSNISCPKETFEEFFENGYQEMIIEIDQKIAGDKNKNDNNIIDDYNYETLNKDRSKLCKNSTRFHEEASKENFENEPQQVIMKVENVDDKNPVIEITKESNKHEEIILKENYDNRYIYKTLKKPKRRKCSVNICANRLANKKSKSDKDFFYFPKLKFPERHNAWIRACHRDKAWKPNGSSSVICEDHFDSFDFVVCWSTKKKKNLKRNAVPHLNLDPSITVYHDSQLPPKKNTLADQALKDKLKSLDFRGEEESKVNIITIDPMKDIPGHEVKNEEDLVKEHECSICKKIFVNQRYLSQHMSKHILSPHKASKVNKQ